MRACCTRTRVRPCAARMPPATHADCNHTLQPQTCHSYAISTASAVVMSTLQVRCEKGVTAASEPVNAAGGRYRPRPPKPVESCEFTINYS